MWKKLISVCLLALPLCVFAEEFIAGKDYQIINNSTDKQSLDKISIIEFFSYGCPWCYRIEPSLSVWVKKNSERVSFSRIPVVFHKDWLLYAKAYYTALLLGLSEKLNPALFKAIQDEKLALNTNENMIIFFTDQGVENSTAKSAFEHSTTIDMRVNEGITMMARFGINGVPAVIVNQQYKTDLQMAQDEQRMFKIIEFLVNKARQQKMTN